MIITATPGTALGRLCRLVAQLEPGQCRIISHQDLAEVRSFEHNDATFTPADRVLGNICGSAYSHSFSVRPDGSGVEFCAHTIGDRIRYVSPDQRPKRWPVAAMGFTSVSAVTLTRVEVAGVSYAIDPPYQIEAGGLDFTVNAYSDGRAEILPDDQPAEPMPGQWMRRMGKVQIA
jgi:hypothetical protein